MKTIRKSIATKVVVAIVSLATAAFMLGIVGLTTAQAQSEEDVQAQIEALLETIAELQAQLDGNVSVSADADGYQCDIAGSAFLRTDLSVGSQGVAVKQLQTYLNQHPDTRLAATGAGSPGMETMYYGNLTANAVSRFQAKFSAQVLAPIGLTSPTGYWGNQSRSQAEQVCDANDTDEEMNEDNNMDEDMDEDMSELDGGETSLEEYDISDGDDGDVNEGEMGEVAEVEFDVEDGDAIVERIDVSFAHDEEANEEADDDPWDVFETVSIMVDGDEVASVDAGNEDDWLDDDTDQPVGIRLNDVDWTVEAGETAMFTVAVEVQNGVDGIESGNTTWRVSIEDEGIRAVDELDIQHYIGNEGEEVDFDIEEEGEGEELSLSTASDNPDESTIAVEESNQSETYAITVGELEAEDGDFEVQQVSAEFVVYATSSSQDIDDITYDDVVSELWLEIGDETFDVDDVDDASEATTTNSGGDEAYVYDVTFDVDGDYTVEADEEVNVSILAEFNEAEDNYDSGQEISANIVEVEAEGSDDVSTNSTVEGEVQTLSVFAIEAELTDSSDSGRQDTLTIEITASENGEDVYIPAGVASTSAATDNDGFIFEGDFGTTTASEIKNDEDLDDVTVNGETYYLVGNGETEEFVLEFTYEAVADNDDDGDVTVDIIQYTDDNDQDPVLELDEDVDFGA